ncbi:uncharacterized protein LOC117114776 [Anneissia japonica]|uniref:uncharacterized protein LOC117114776 n=1 Tax=Anneissia japonica TaxID=1529436 RepID=UPI0014258C53|nr:uncharacterized protein LOC117114776 [Anneissia japonica]
MRPGRHNSSDERRGEDRGSGSSNGRQNNNGGNGTINSRPGRHNSSDERQGEDRGSGSSNGRQTNNGGNGTINSRPGRHNSSDDRGGEDRGSGSSNGRQNGNGGNGTITSRPGRHNSSDNRHGEDRGSGSSNGRQNGNGGNGTITSRPGRHNSSDGRQVEDRSDRVFPPSRGSGSSNGRQNGNGGDSTITSRPGRHTSSDGRRDEDRGDRVSPPSRGSGSSNGRQNEGSCPAPEDGTVGICSEMCSSDNDCEGSMKCCSNGCGHVCKNPLCPEVLCRIYCEHGHQQDENGCDLCVCKECDGEVDCNGDCGGTATINRCQQCVGGRTRKRNNYGMDECGHCIRHDGYVNTMDCNDVCDGEAEENECGVCVGGSTGRDEDSGLDSCGQCKTSRRRGSPASRPTKDCNDVCGGTARTDLCGECVGGTTGVAENVNQHRLNCLGQCETADGPRYVRNDCGQCVRAPTDGSDPPTARDCNGNCTTGRRRAKLDKTCGICYGGRTGIEKDNIKNECGVCTNEEDEAVRTACFGCDRVLNSGLVEDACGRCGGDGSGCQTIQSVRPKLILNSEGQKFTIFGAGFKDGSRNARAVPRNRRAVTGVSCVIASQTTNFNAEWPVSDADLTVTTVTCRLSEGDPLPNGVYEITVRKGSEVITGNEAIRLRVYQPPEIVSLVPREFDAVKGGPLNFKINVTFADSTQLTQYENLVPKLIVRGDVYMEGRVISDTIMSFRVTLKKYTSMTFIVQPSFDGRAPLPGGDDGVDGFTVTVFSEGPRLERAKVQNDGGGVKVKFNRNVNTDELQTCDAIFANAERLGGGAECEWKSQRSLVVTFGENSELGAGDSLRVNPGAIGGFKQKHSRTSEDDEISIEGPQNAQAPVAICEVPSEISSCGNLQVRGEKSRGGGKRGLKRQWNITKNGEVDTSLQRQLDGFNRGDDGWGRKSFELDGSVIEPNVEYELTLSVENSLGIRHNVSRRFRKASIPKPTVTIRVKNGDAEAARVSKSLTLSAQVEYQEGCFDVGQTNFEWSWNNQDANIDDKNRFSRKLLIPAKSLPGGKIIRFTVNVSREGDTSTYATDFIDIRAVNTDLKAIIWGSKSRQIGCRSGLVELDGSRSQDPDEDAHEMSYDWTCEQITDNLPCYSYRDEDEEGVKFASQRDNRTLKFNSDQMEPDKEYLFTLQVQKGERFARTEATISCSEEEPIEIELSTNNDEGLYNSDDEIDVKAKIRSNLEVTNFTWVTDISQNDLAEEDEMCSPYFFLCEGALAKGAKYLLRFTATTEDGRTGTSAIEIRTRGGIKRCEVNVQGEYIPLEKVRCEITGCTVDEDDYPLSFQVLRKDAIADDSERDGEQRKFSTALSEPTNEPGFEVVASQPNNDETRVHLEFQICSVSSCIATEITVEVVERENPLSEVEKDAFFEENVEEERQKGNLVEALLGLNALVLTTDQSTPGSRRRKRNADQEDIAEYGSLQIDLLNELQSAGNLGSRDRQAVLDQTRHLAFEYMNSTTRRKAVESIRNLLEDEDESLEFEPLDIERGRNVLSSLSDAAEGINPQEDRELADEIKSAQRLVLRKLSRGLSFEDEIEEETSDVNFKAVRSQLGDRLSTYTGDGAASVNFGETLKERFATDWDCDDDRTCSDVIVKFSHYKDGVDLSSFNEEDAQTVIADIIDISIANPETGDDIEISDLQTPVTIDIPIKEIPEGKRPVGKFMNKETSAWDSEGVETTVSEDRRTVTIASTHLTEFTVVINTLIVIVIVGAVAIAFILVFVLTVVVWPRFKKRKQVSPTPSKENIKE